MSSGVSLDKQKRVTALGFRRVVQALFFVVLTLGAINHTLSDMGVSIPLVSNASLHAICPFGGVVTLWRFISTGTLVRQIHESSMVMLGITLVLALLLGPVFCGWVCPFGTFQEFVSKLGKKVFGKRFNRMVPTKLDQVLRYGRYFILGWAVYMTTLTGVLVFKPYDPYFTLFNFWTGEAALTGYIALGIVVGLSLVMERPFCKYACPMGAVLGVTNLIRIFGIRREASTCINCNLCTNICPMNIHVATAGRIYNHQCISCGECTSERVCPVEKTVVWKPWSLPVIGNSTMSNSSNPGGKI